MQQRTRRDVLLARRATGNGDEALQAAALAVCVGSPIARCTRHFCSQWWPLQLCCKGPAIERFRQLGHPEALQSDRVLLTDSDGHSTSQALNALRLNPGRAALRTGPPCRCIALSRPPRLGCLICKEEQGLDTTRLVPVPNLNGECGMGADARQMQTHLGW